MRRNKEGDIRRIPSPNDNELSAARSETHVGMGLRGLPTWTMDGKRISGLAD
jgi:hypothetical protein